MAAPDVASIPLAPTAKPRYRPGMNIPDGFETVKQRSIRTGVPERTIHYWLDKGKLAFKSIKVPVRVIPIEAQPIGTLVKRI
jgi:hypothetical protein